MPYRWHDVERDDEGSRLFEVAGGDRTDLPLVLVPDREPLRCPTLLEAAGALGLHVEAEHPLYDVCIVGGGPAGLAAGVYAASEGLSTVIVEREAPGGQAGQSSAIENYLGFPKGLSGSDLAQRALAQVSRFGAELVLAREVVGLEQRGTVRAVLLEGGAEVEARSVVVSTGVSYRRLEAEGVERLTGQGHLLRRHRGGGSADRRRDGLRRRRSELRRPGRAELRQARQAGHPRGPRIRPAGHDVDVPGGPDHGRPQHHRALRAPRSVPPTATSHLERLTLVDRASGQREEVEASWLYVFIGASPRTDWLGEPVARDSHGFVLTGPEVVTSGAPWGLARAPFALETSMPGVFAAGDVRLDSMKRVASAVGEGAMSIYLVHRYLATV